jgi:hypothetical protein
MNMTEFRCVPALAEYLNGADHVDVKSCCGESSLRECVAGILSYSPRWVRALYKIRVWVLRLLGQGQGDSIELDRVTAESLSVEKGDKANFVTVADSDGETYWIGTAEESYLGMALGVAVESIDGEDRDKLFHVVTVVQYRNRVGAIYFNLIRPFHYLVVSLTMRQIFSSRKEQD